MEQSRSRLTLQITLGALLATGLAFLSTAAEGTVTFHQDVQPILAKYCQNCHRPGQAAPMSFMTYETTRPWAAQIKAMVTAKKMPPSIGSPHYMVLTRGEGLTPEEVHTLVAWVDEGAPEGSARKPDRKK